MEPIYACALAIDGYALLPVAEGRKPLDQTEQLQNEAPLDELSTTELRLALFYGNRAERWDAQPYEWETPGLRGRWSGRLVRNLPVRRRTSGTGGHAPPSA